MLRKRLVMEMVGRGRVLGVPVSIITSLPQVAGARPANVANCQRPENNEQNTKKNISHTQHTIPRPYLYRKARSLQQILTLTLMPT